MQTDCPTGADEKVKLNKGEDKLQKVEEALHG